MESFNWIGLITALGGFGAAALFIREIVNIVALMRKGVSAKENRRRSDIVAQRDAAIAERDAANRRVAISQARIDQELENRRLLQAFAARLERQLIIVGSEPQHAWPDIDESTDPIRTKETP